MNANEVRVDRPFEPKANAAPEHHLRGAKLLEDFFGGQGDGAVHVEARDASGELAPPEGRHAMGVLAFSNTARRWMLAAAGGAIMASGTAIAAQPGPSPGLGSAHAITRAIENQAKGQIVASFAANVEPELADQVHAAAQSGVSSSYKLRVDNEAFPGFSGPAASVVIADDKSVTCKVSLDGLQQVMALFSPRQADGAASHPRQRRLREFIVHHEVAHCDYGAEILRAAAAGPEEPVTPIGMTGFTFKDLVALHKELEANSSRNLGSTAFAVTFFEGKLNELNADTRAALYIASRTIGAASSQEQVMVAREEFASHIDDVIRARSNLAAIDPTRDSSALLQSIKTHVLSKSRTAEGLQELQRGALAPANVSGQALEWSIGYVAHTTEPFLKEAAKVLLAAPPEALPERARQIMATNRQRIGELVETNGPMLLDEIGMSGTSSQMVQRMQESFLLLQKHSAQASSVDGRVTKGKTPMEEEQARLCGKDQMLAFKNRVRDAADTPDAADAADAASPVGCAPVRQRGG